MRKKYVLLFVLLSSMAWYPGCWKKAELQDGKTAEEARSNGKIIDIADKDEFDEVLTSNEVVLVYFYADWCSACKILKPTIYEIAGEYDGSIAVVAVNVEKLSDLADKYEIQSIPDVKIFKQGKIEETLIGIRDTKVYIDIIDRLLRN